MLDVNPLLHLTSIDIANHKYTLPCANLLKGHFPNRFSFQAGDSKTQLAKLENGTARQFDIIHIDGGHDEGAVICDLGLRWSHFPGQFGGLAKVDSGFDYAANFSSLACVA
jgi:hypothetical protein